MANKRMFSLSVIDTDEFIEMPMSARLLYYELGMRADDDGFVPNWKKILLFTGTKEDDMKILISKSFIIPFESGVIVIRHWRLNNYLQKDRYKETIYKQEMALLSQNENGVYRLNTDCIHDVYKLDTQNSIDKNSIEENSIDKNNIPKKETKNKYGEYKHVLLTQNEYNSLMSDYSNYDELITYLDEYIEMKGYKAKSHYFCIKKWVIDAVKQKNKKQVTNKSNDGWNYIDEQLDKNNLF